MRNNNQEVLMEFYSNIDDVDSRWEQYVQNDKVLLGIFNGLLKNQFLLYNVSLNTEAGYNPINIHHVKCAFLLLYHLIGKDKLERVFYFPWLGAEIIVALQYDLFYIRHVSTNPIIFCAIVVIEHMIQYQTGDTLNERLEKGFKFVGLKREAFVGPLRVYLDDLEEYSVTLH